MVRSISSTSIRLCADAYHSNTMAAFVTPQCGVVQVNLAERARTASVAIAAIVEIAAIVISCLLFVGGVYESRQYR
jgi:hypothetical protein